MVAEGDVCERGGRSGREWRNIRSWELQESSGGSVLAVNKTPPLYSLVPVDLAGNGCAGDFACFGYLALSHWA